MNDLRPVYCGSCKNYIFDGTKWKCYYNLQSENHTVKFEGCHKYNSIEDEIFKREYFGKLSLMDKIKLLFIKMKTYDSDTRYIGRPIKYRIRYKKLGKKIIVYEEKNI